MINTVSERVRLTLPVVEQLENVGAVILAVVVEAHVTKPMVQIVGHTAPENLKATARTVRITLQTDRCIADVLGVEVFWLQDHIET